MIRKLQNENRNQHNLTRADYKTAPTMPDVGLSRVGPFYIAQSEDDRWEEINANKNVLKAIHRSLPEYLERCSEKLKPQILSNEIGIFRRSNPKAYPRKL